VSIHQIDRQGGAKYVVYDKAGNIVIISTDKKVCLAVMTKQLAA
jgi:hypothetical protein